MNGLMRMTVGAMVAAAMAMGGCASAPRSASGPVTGPARVDSATLLRPMGGILAEAVIARAQQGGSLPADYKTAEFVEGVIETLRLQYPDVFSVTEEQERKLAAWEFDDAANRRRAEEALARMESEKVKPSTINGFLAEELRSGRLSRLRLEIAARLLQAQMQASLVSGLGEAL